MQNVFQLFFHPGEVVEIRAIGIEGKNPDWEGFAKGIVGGYFDKTAAFETCAMILDKAQARGIYFTITPVTRRS